MPIDRRRKLLILRRGLLLMLLLDQLEEGDQQRSPERLELTMSDPPPQQQARREFERLVNELQLSDAVNFTSYLGMSPQAFEKLFEIVGPSITKKITFWKRPIDPVTRLALTLRYLVTGDFIITVAANYHVGHATAGKIIHETCEALWTVLSVKYLALPDTKQWQCIASDFNQTWDFPNCVGALDGRHVRIQVAKSSRPGSSDEKFYPSVMLLAVCNADFRFTLIDVEFSECPNDTGTFDTLELGLAIENEMLGLPEDAPLSRSKEGMPYVFVADKGFPLTTRIMCPFSSSNLTPDNHVFNCRLLRARQVAENAFGILASKWRIFKRPIALEPKNVDRVVKAGCCLHNYAMSEDHTSYCPDGYADLPLPCGGVMSGEWRKSSGLMDVCHFKNENLSLQAISIRDTFVKYFTSSAGEFAVTI